MQFVRKYGVVGKFSWACSLKRREFHCFLLRIELVGTSRQLNSTQRVVTDAGVNTSVRISMTLIYIYVSDITFTDLSPVPVGRGYFAECGLRNAESCQGVICGKSSAERSAKYPLSLFRIAQPKNSALFTVELYADDLIWLVYSLSLIHI